MTRANELRAQARELFEYASRIGDRAERLPKILRAMELESEADAAERDEAAPRRAQQSDRGQEQQSRRDEDRKK